MKSTLSLKKPLSLEQQAKIFQMMKHTPEPLIKILQATSRNFEQKTKKNSPFVALDWLIETYPLCFSLKNPKPLKKGIIKDIIGQKLWNGSKTSLRSALAIYSDLPNYHKMLLKEDSRYDLKGNQAEKITVSEKDFSKQRLQILKINKRSIKKKGV